MSTERGSGCISTIFRRKKHSIKLQVREKQWDGQGTAGWGHAKNVRLLHTVDQVSA